MKNPALWLLSPAELAETRKAEYLAVLQQELEWAQKGYEVPSICNNGCKTKAALIRKRKEAIELAKAKAPEQFLDVWSEAVDCKYAKKPFALALVNHLCDKQHGECRSLRQQCSDLLTDAGFTLDAEAGIFNPPAQH